MKRRIVKEGRYRTKGWMLNDALQRAQKAMFWLDQAANTVRRVDGEDSEIFIRLDSSRNDVDDTIDDLKQRIDGMEDQEFGTSVSESRKRFVKESGSARAGLEELREDLKKQFKGYEDIDDMYIGKVETDDDDRPVLNVCSDPGVDNLSDVMKYINEKYGKRFDLVLFKAPYKWGSEDRTARVMNLDIYDLEGEKKDKEALDAPSSGPKDLPGQMTLPGFDESQELDEETEWFDSHGDMKKHLPMDCILGCSGGGRVDDEVNYWVNELNFHAPTEKGMSYLQEYGLDDIGPEDVDKYVLWLMCGNIKEEAYEFCRGGMDYDDFETSEYPDDVDDWTEEDWDNFQSEVAICHLGM